MKRKYAILIFALILALSVTACTKTGTDLDEENNPGLENGEENQDEETPDDDSQEAPNKWPQNFMTEAPELDGGIVVVKEEGASKYFIELKNISHDDAIDYIESVKKAGFLDNSNGHIDDNSIRYKGMDKSNNLLIFNWNKSQIAKVELIKSN